MEMSLMHSLKPLFGTFFFLSNSSARNSVLVCQWHSVLNVYYLQSVEFQVQGKVSSNGPYILQNTFPGLQEASFSQHD